MKLFLHLKANYPNKGTCVDIDECERGTHNCGSKQCFNVEGTFRCTTVVDVVWAVDGTGSYKTYIEDAKNNFKARVACIQHYVSGVGICRENVK